jgi:hypothetical protein
MDRYSAWPGRTGRPRRVPPRVAPSRRGRTQAASWTGGRRWFVALGTLALALLLPRLLAGQGLRSAPAAIVLRVTAPEAGRAGPAWRGASVVDVPLALPQPGWAVQRVELQLAGAKSDATTLHVRDADGRFAPLSTHWQAIGATSGVRVRIVRAGGPALAPGAWHVRYRLVPRDAGEAGEAAHEGAAALRIDETR